MTREQVNIICDALWDFHNARLEDPELHTMDKYVQPILDLIDSATREARLEGYKKGYIDAGIKAITEQSGERDAD